jgi:type IV secretory pathway VirB6-like protein
LLLLCSCTDEDGVIGADDFSLDDIPKITIQANPSLTPDSSKYYTNMADGQKAMWTEVNYLTNGQHIVLEISGKWTAWYGNNATLYIPETEKCEMVNIGEAPLEIYSAATNYQNPITMEPFHPNLQEPCWFEGGTGLYLGLFGPTGTVLPKIMFHLQTTGKSCNSPYEEIDGDCVFQNEGVIEKTNKWTYKYTTVGDPIWGGTPKPNQKIKLIILDSHYRDNFGNYKIKFLSGVNLAGTGETSGIISSVVKIIEDAVFGYQDADGNLHKGIIEILYKQLLVDSIFGDLIRILLILAIAILGLGIITGTTKLTQKEILNRVLKIGLVLLFTSNNAWQFFNDFVITWFIQGTSFIITFFISIISEIFPIQIENLGLDIAIGKRSLASNFNFIDYIFRFLFSTTIQTKIWALLFTDIFVFGLITIPLIYISILGFVVVLIYFAQLYIFYILQIAFALALAPIFVSLILFEKTKHIFFTWLTFLIGRTIEVVLMFLFVYLMVGLILTSYIKLFSYAVETRPLFEALWTQIYTLGLGAIKVWKAIGITQFEVILQILIILGLTYIMFMMISLSSLVANTISSAGYPSSDKVSKLAMNTFKNIWGNLMKPTLSTINRIPQFEIAGIPVSQMVGLGKRKTITGEARDVAKVIYKKAGGKEGIARVTAKVALWPALISTYAITEKKIFESPAATTRRKRRESADKIIQTTIQEGLNKGLTGNKLEAHVRKNTISKMQKDDKIASYTFAKKDQIPFFLKKLDNHYQLEAASSSLQKRINEQGIDNVYKEKTVNRIEAIYNELPEEEQKKVSIENISSVSRQIMLAEELAKNKGKTFEETKKSIIESGDLDKLKEKTKEIPPNENMFAKELERLAKERLKGIRSWEERTKELKELQQKKEIQIEKEKSELGRKKSETQNKINKLKRKPEAQRTAEEKTRLSRLETEHKDLTKQLEAFKEK